MKTTLYTAGYLIRVTSWENDGDNYNTKELQVDTEQEARTVSALCDLLRSRYRVDHPTFGNMYEPSDTDIQEFASAVAAIPGIKEFVQTVFPNIEENQKDPECGFGYMDCIMDILYDLGLSGSEYYYTRVCDTVSIFHIPADVVVEEVQFK